MMGDRVGGGMSLMAAKKLVVAPNFRDNITKQQYNTDDIILLINEVHDINIKKGRTEKLAKALRGRNDKETLKNVYHFVQSCIKYVKDNNGYERVKEDNVTIHEGYSDCKGMSLLINSIVHHYGFSYEYKFVKYVTYFLGIPSVSQHVYPIVVTGGGQIFVLDAVNTYGGFNNELPFDELLGTIKSKGFPDNVGDTPPSVSNGFFTKLLWFGMGVIAINKLSKK